MDILVFHLDEAAWRLDCEDEGMQCAPAQKLGPARRLG